MADTPVNAYPTYDAKYQVFGSDSHGQRAVHSNLHGLGPGLGQALRAQHQFDLGGANGHGERAKSSVGGGMAVAADDGLAGLGVSLLPAQ